MLGPTVGIFVDYESPLAREVAGRIWTGLSVAVLGAGYIAVEMAVRCRVEIVASKP